MYKERVKTIPIFDNIKIKSLCTEQRKLFAKTFYHIRGHFHNFLWYIGNFTNNKSFKKIVVDNIADELNYEGYSHEKLYFIFAEEFGIDPLSEGNNIYFSLIQSTSFLEKESDLVCLNEYLNK